MEVVPSPSQVKLNLFQVDVLSMLQAKNTQSNDQIPNNQSNKTSNEPIIMEGQEEGSNVQKPHKKRKVAEESTSNSVGNLGKSKPCRPRSWAWGYFTRDPRVKNLGLYLIGVPGVILTIFM